jgi:hypothetical protein
MQIANVGPANLDYFDRMAQELGGRFPAEWRLARQLLQEAEAYQPVPGLPLSERIPPEKITCSFTHNEHLQLRGTTIVDPSTGCTTKQGQLVEQLAPHESPTAAAHVWGRKEWDKIPRRQRPITDTFVINRWLKNRKLEVSTRMARLEDARLSTLQGGQSLPLDMKSWFFQFVVSREVALLQCHFFEGAWWCWLRLAMGMLFACYIAQLALDMLAQYAMHRTATATHPATRLHTLTYVDNLKYTGTTEELLQVGMSFVRTCAEANVAVGEFYSLGITASNFEDRTADIHATLETLISEKCDFIGLSLDHKSKEVRLTQKVVTKIEAAWAIRSTWTVRNACSFIALLIYATYARGLRFWPWFHTFRMLGQLHCSAREGTSWDQPLHQVLHADEATQAELERWAHACMLNEAVPVTSTTSLPQYLYVTDACATSFSAITISLATGEVRCFRDRWPRLIPDSGESEPLAIVAGLLALFPPDFAARVHSLSDNAASVGAFPAGKSRAAHLNVLIGTLASQRPMLDMTYEHIPGRDNIMDATSRTSHVLSVDELRHFLDQRGYVTQLKVIGSELRFVDGRVTDGEKKDWRPMPVNMSMRSSCPSPCE